MVSVNSRVKPLLWVKEKHSLGKEFQNLAVRGKKLFI